MSEIQELTEFLKLLSAETDRRFREMSAETDRRFQETDHELKKTERLIKELTRNISGISDSNGLSAEQFFASALQYSLSLNGQTFEACSRNTDRLQKIDGKLVASEYDVVLKRPDAIALVEIKYRLRKDDVEALAERKIKNFRILYPEESAGKSIYLAAVGLSIDGGALKRAKELGAYVLTQLGDAMHILNDEARAD